jgi:hypothetical protein
MAALRRRRRWRADLFSTLIACLDQFVIEDRGGVDGGPFEEFPKVPLPAAAPFLKVPGNGYSAVGFQEFGDAEHDRGRVPSVIYEQCAGLAADSTKFLLGN